MIARNGRESTHSPQSPNTFIKRRGKHIVDVTKDRIRLLAFHFLAEKVDYRLKLLGSGDLKDGFS